jgi:hypothetical protein
MLGFSPLASATLADDGIVTIAIGADGITSGVPIVAASTVSQSHSLGAVGITTNAPVVGTPEADRVLPTAEITAGTPVIDTPLVDQDHIFRRHLGGFRVSASGGKFYLQDYDTMDGALGPYIETPSLELHSGAGSQSRMYRFWLTGSGMYSGGSAIHDFRLRTPDGTEYTDGVVFTGGLGYERLELTLGANPPQYLQYYCANHSGMGGDIFIRIVSSSAEGNLDTEIITGSATIDASDIVVNHVLAADSISTSAPTIDNSTASIIHNLPAQNIVTGTPVVEAPVITGVHSLAATDITAGAPTIEASTLVENVALTSTDITTAAPIVANATANIVTLLTSDVISTGTPTVGVPSITQIHSITLDDIVAGAPIVGPARFKWQVEPVGPETWTEQAVGAETWTEQGSTDPTWTEQEAA